MDDLDFLSHLPPSEAGQATLRILLPDGTITSIEQSISHFIFLDKCPLLFHSFEYGAHNAIAQACIEAPSKTAVICLLRFCYTGSYLPPIDQDVNQRTDLILHAQVYKVADDLDVPELQVAAYVNLMQDTQVASCLATPPRDLCETIRFMYQYLDNKHARSQHSIIDLVLNYCLYIFKYQSLDLNPDFLEVVSELPKFHKDLCRINMERHFEDEGAIDVLHLISHPTPCTTSALSKRALGDFQHELMCDSPTDEKFLSGLDTDTETEAERNPAKRRKSGACSGTVTLVQRPKIPRAAPVDSGDESLGEDSGFTLVCRPKLKVSARATPNVKTQVDSVLSIVERVNLGPGNAESIANSEDCGKHPEEEWASSSDFESVAGDKSPMSPTEDGWTVL